MPQIFLVLINDEQRKNNALLGMRFSYDAKVS